MITSPIAQHKKKSLSKITPSQVFSDPYCFLAFGFGAGLAPVAPGTFGTLAAIPLYCLLANLSVPLYLAVTITLALAGIYICQRSQEILKIGDHPGIVWDEMVGFLITMTAVSPHWTSILLGFMAFRIFDILKPWPIARFDRTLHGGFGVMLDDVLAGLYALALLGMLQ
jgi:phosphatidylglycerophosphatase A